MPYYKNHFGEGGCQSLGEVVVGDANLIRADYFLDHVIELAVNEFMGK